MGVLLCGSSGWLARVNHQQLSVISLLDQMFCCLGQRLDANVERKEAADLWNAASSEVDRLEAEINLARAIVTRANSGTITGYISSPYLSLCSNYCELILQTGHKNSPSP
jgi:hypothetical protein